MYKFVVLLVCCFFGIGFKAYSQPLSSNKKAQTEYDKAAQLLRSNDFKGAANNLENAIKIDPSFATAYQQLGDIYRRLQDYEAAIKVYQKVLEINPNLTPLTYFGLGEAFLFCGQYEAALKNLKLYEDKGKLLEKSAVLVQKYLLDCEFALKNKNNLTTFSITPVNRINTNDDEYFPQLTADNQTIIFTRKSANQENFYEGTLKNSVWTDIKKLVGEVNSDKFNEGAHCISPDGKYLFFTGCNRPGGLGSCDIYVSKKENGHWSEPYNLGTPINTRGWEAQPSISADGKTLFFVSNRAGGQGGYDIWKSTLNSDGNWNNPVNLGPSINTPYDEGAPYIHADNKTLFFASDGWPGFGKKDIFRSVMDEKGNWSTPQNLGYPVNNHLDQLSMHVSMDGKIAHLASQNLDKQLDIYSFEIPEKQRPHSVAFIKGVVLDAHSKQPLDAKISVTNTTNNTIVFEDISDPTDGQFLATLPIGNNYAVHVQREGYLFDSKKYALDDPIVSNEKFEDQILLRPIESGSTTTLNNIYFDINKAELLAISKSDLDILVSFLKLNSKLTIELSGHTDNTGNKSNNQILSENRAKAVVSYLVDNGISRNRLRAVGYGDSQPIADNSTEDGRQLNRRTEFKITNL